MDFPPWTSFTRVVERYGGDHRMRTLSCAEQYRAMAFAQPTYRESPRDIETRLSVHASKLHHMGFRQTVRRSTLADANQRRDWRIYAELAQRLIAQARKLYADEEPGLELTDTVYALDSTTIALCLPVFPWAHFRTTKAAVKMHTPLDLRGNIPSFIDISDGKPRDVHALDMPMPEAGAIYVVDRGYVDFARLHVLHHAGAFFVTRAKSNIDAHRVYSAPTDRSTGIICDQTISLAEGTMAISPASAPIRAAKSARSWSASAGASSGLWRQGRSLRPMPASPATFEAMSSGDREAQLRNATPSEMSNRWRWFGIMALGLAARGAILRGSAG